MSSLRIGIQAIKTIKNWPMYALDKFGLIQNDYILNCHGLSCFVRSHSMDKWVLMENVVLDQYRLKKFAGQQFDTIVDLGAHIGTFTLQAAHLFPDTQIISFEPSPENYKMLVRNVRLNGIQDRVTTVRSAVTTHKAATVSLFFGDTTDIYSTSVRMPNAITVPNMFIGELIRTVNRRALLKMDIEGEEKNLLGKYESALRKTFDVILSEQHTFHTVYSTESVQETLYASAQGIKVMERGKKDVLLNHPQQDPNFRVPVYSRYGDTTTVKDIHN